MTLYEFNSLNSVSEPTTVICCEGEFLMDRPREKIKIAPYQKYSFYVEINYNGETNTTKKLRIFFATGALEPCGRNASIFHGSISILRNSEDFNFITLF